MTQENKPNRIIKQFYYTLDKEVADSLDEKQKQAIESAVQSMGLVAKHSIDMRKAFPWFGKRYYMVFLLGRDRRKQLRSGEVIASTILALLAIIAVVGVCGLAVLALYLIKSALGIDIFKDFSFGVWDWFKDIMH